MVAKILDKFLEAFFYAWCIGSAIIFAVTPFVVLYMLIYFAFFR